MNIFEARKTIKNHAMFPDEESQLDALASLARDLIATHPDAVRLSASNSSGRRTVTFLVNDSIEKAYILSAATYGSEPGADGSFWTQDIDYVGPGCAVGIDERGEYSIIAAVDTSAFLSFLDD